MKATALALAEVMLLEPRVFADGRGAFFESFSTRTFADVTGVTLPFVQDNHSVSGRGVVRGLHYQLPPHAQGKLVRVVVGEIFDVAVDLRRASPDYGKWVGEILSAQNRQQLWVPPGFAHGFMALSETAELIYKTTDYYAPAAERTIRWDDPALGIGWPEGLAPVLSARDAAAAGFAQAEPFD